MALPLRDRAGADAAALGGVALDIHHIGSTSVPGLAAKPIIDICLVVDDVEDDEAFGPVLEAEGFPLRVREPDHRMFRPPARDVHVHVYERGSKEIVDYLDLPRLASPGRRRSGALCVGEDASSQPRSWHDMNRYAEAKAPVVSDTLRRAREWRCARNRAVVERLFDEVWNGRRLDLVDELYAPDVVFDYTPYAPVGHGRDAIRQSLQPRGARSPTTTRSCCR